MSTLLQFSRLSAEQAINSLHGIWNCQVVVSPTDEIQEIQVLSDMTRPPNLIIRDIEMLLRTRFDLEVDDRKFGVVQLRGCPPESPTVLRGRPRLVEVHVTDEPEGRLLAVVIEATEEGPQGRHTPYTSTTTLTGDEAVDHRLVASATLSALRSLLVPSISARVEAAKVVRLTDEWRVANVIVLAEHGGMFQPYLGGSLVHGDPLDALARATLSALNRRIDTTRPPA